MGAGRPLFSREEYPFDFDFFSANAVCLIPISLPFKMIAARTTALNAGSGSVWIQQRSFTRA
jgi:hypothetical protein